MTLGMHRISGWPDTGIWSDNPAFFISGIRPDTGYIKPDIRPDFRLSKRPDIRTDIWPKMQLRNYI